MDSHTGLSHLTSLQELEIEEIHPVQNNTTAGPLLLALPPSLTKVDLEFLFSYQGSRLPIKHAQSLSALTNMRHLNLAHASMTFNEDSMEELCALSPLQSLHLHHCGLSGAKVVALVKSQPVCITELLMMHSEFPAAAVQPLVALTSLQSISLGEKSVSSDAGVWGLAFHVSAFVDLAKLEMSLRYTQSAGGDLMQSLQTLPRTGSSAQFRETSRSLQWLALGS